MKKTPMRRRGTTVPTTIPAIAPDERLLCIAASTPGVVLVALGKGGGIGVMIGGTDEVDVVIGRTDRLIGGSEVFGWRITVSLEDQLHQPTPGKQIF